jgi:hypothetical protein
VVGCAVGGAVGYFASCGDINAAAQGCAIGALSELGLFGVGIAWRATGWSRSLFGLGGLGAALRADLRATSGALAAATGRAVGAASRPSAAPHRSHQTTTGLRWRPPRGNYT